MAHLYPALYKQAVRCEEYPELPPARLTRQSNLTLVWKCRCGNETRLKVNNVVNRGRVVCDRLPDLRVWAAKDDAWWRAFALMQQFAEREEHTRVPSGHKEQDLRLDLFVAKQRQRYDQQILDADRVAALEELPGWVWRSRRRRSDAGQQRQRT